MARWVIDSDGDGDFDTEPLMRKLTNLVADDMRAYVPVRLGHLKAGIEVAVVTADTGIIISKRLESGEDSEEVPVYVETGTSDTPAQPYMRPAVYQYRAP